MSGLQRMPVIAGVAGIGTSLAVLASIPSFRQRLSTVLGLSAPGGIWRVLAILFALLNLKSLPFVWHIRLFRALTYHLYLNPYPITPDSLFRPIITSTRTPLLECDYNLHKSNSTYFSDLDISRTHLVTTLLRSGIRQLGRKPQATQSAAAPDNGGGGSAPGGAEALPPPPANGRFAIALGGITCHFRREIAPYQKFEIHTRLLCWDRKWLYLVSHLVKPGVARPSGYALQPWKKGKAVKAEEEEAYREKLRRAVFASSIAKYVVKKGRLTIPPEDVLRRNGLLPPRPNEAATTSTSSTEGANTEQGETISNGAPPEMIDALDADDSDSDAEWTWEKVEAERVRGMKLAELFAGLDGLHEEFTGGRDGVLGEYPDLLW
ncbi:hypothetical protein H2201_003809 [Coniosporium apollinis]|uniref:Capsule polysaccharide biosynthesis protein n=1 Tax=Coniosporium apollinis TaxID=61459 RepID=A0ABQ9NWR5_9PEZI|nr:hypothetical protein H2201_003809 [Coniosporium apollinis]